MSGSSTLGDEERRIVDDVFDAGSRGLREVMLPRTEVDFLPGDLPAYKAVREVLQAPHSRYPVMGDSADDIIGFVHVRDLLDPEVSNRSTPVSDLVRPVVSLPDTVRVLRALSDMRREPAATWPSCWTSTAARPASSPWRTWSRSWWATSPTSTTWSSRPPTSPDPTPSRWTGSAPSTTSPSRPVSCSPRGRTTPWPGSSWPLADSCRPSQATRGGRGAAAGRGGRRDRPDSSSP